MSGICDTNNRGLENVALLTSIGGWEDFLASTVWVDLRTTLELMLKDVRDNLERASADELASIQGQSKILRQIISLPENLLDGLKTGNYDEE